MRAARKLQQLQERLNQLVETMGFKTLKDVMDKIDGNTEEVEGNSGSIYAEVSVSSNDGEYEVEVTWIGGEEKDPQDEIGDTQHLCDVTIKGDKVLAKTYVIKGTVLLGKVGEWDDVYDKLRGMVLSYLHGVVKDLD